MAHNGNQLWPGWETLRFLRRDGYNLIYEIRQQDALQEKHALVKVIPIPYGPEVIWQMRSQGCDDQTIASTFRNQMQQIVAEHHRAQRSSDNIRCIPHEDGLGWNVCIKYDPQSAVSAPVAVPVLPEQQPSPPQSPLSIDEPPQKGSSRTIAVAVIVILLILALGSALLLRLLPERSSGAGLRKEDAAQTEDSSRTSPSAETADPSGATFPEISIVVPTQPAPTAAPTVPQEMPQVPTVPVSAPGKLRSDPHVTEEDYNSINRNVMLSIESSDAAVFGSGYTRDQIASITFLDSTASAPSALWWDVSAQGDASVIAWVTPREGLYDLYIASDGGIIAPENCDSLFAEYIHVTSIDFGSCFDTSQVTNMRNMFHFCMSLTELDVSGFDTSNVTDMRNMFFACKSLPELDVSGFNTSKVTDMRFLFARCSSLTVLNVSNFDTSNVIYMGNMFNRCGKVAQLDVSGFDTGNVRQMCFLFAFCNSVKELDVSGFDTSNVENMEGMFNHCTALETLNVRNFDTSHVNNMRQMFRDCTGLKALDVTGFDLSGLDSSGDLDNFMEGTDLHNPFAGWTYTG